MRKNTRKKEVLIPNTIIGDTLREAKNFNKKISKQKISKNGNTYSA